MDKGRVEYAKVYWLDVVIEHTRRIIHQHEALLARDVGVVNLDREGIFYDGSEEYLERLLKETVGEHWAYFDLPVTEDWAVRHGWFLK